MNSINDNKACHLHSGKDREVIVNHKSSNHTRPYTQNQKPGTLKTLQLMFLPVLNQSSIKSSTFNIFIYTSLIFIPCLDFLYRYRKEIKLNQLVMQIHCDFMELTWTFIWTVISLLIKTFWINEHQWTALSREITWNKFKSKEQDSIKFYILEC